MIRFHTPTELPIEAATVMGVSVKTDGAIGKFGTGLKYAIAGILRLSGTITVIVNDETFDFTSKPTDIRGKEFGIVHCNGQQCGFTTDLGKHWQPWQLFRELASNSLDEGGSWTNADEVPAGSVTVIVVDCKAVEAAEKDEGVFIGQRPVLLASMNGATLHAGPNRHFYYKGIRAGSFEFEAPVTIDVSCGTLSEDRLLDTGTMLREVTWAFLTATDDFDHALMETVIMSDDKGGFWTRVITEHEFSYSIVSKPVMDFMLERRKVVRHPAFKVAMERHLRKNGGNYEALEPTTMQLLLLGAGEALCASVGVDSIPRDKVHFTRDMPDGQLAVTMMDTRVVWFSTHITACNREEFLSCYLEEAIHAMTGHRDCTREFQNMVLSIVVRLATSTELRAAA